MKYMHHKNIYGSSEYMVLQKHFKKWRKDSTTPCNVKISLELLSRTENCVPYSEQITGQTIKHSKILRNSV